MYTSTTAFVEALVEQGIDYIFANLGSDHPALLETLAEAASCGRPVPRLITCPNEMVALSIAHGFAQATGRAQAVVIHVECGTQALAGAIHNAAKARVPVLIFAGASPFTQEGEMLGSRNEFIQWIQDVHDQRGLVRGYMRYDNEFRTGANVKQIVHRAMQFAYSAPQGPVYLMGAREVMEAPAEPVAIDMDEWRPVEPAGLSEGGVATIVAALREASRPLIVTSYVGRRPEAVTALVRLCRLAGIGVVESVPNYMNFPHDDPLYQGCQFNQPVQNIALAEADMVLVVDSDVPWIPTISRPRAGAPIYHIDTDPLKDQMPLWYIRPRRSYGAEAVLALKQLADRIDRDGIDAGMVAQRKRHYAERHGDRARRLGEAERSEEAISAPAFLATLRGRLRLDAIVLNEGITNYHLIFDHLACIQPGTMFTSGGGSLGWNGGAALGMKLAHPDRDVVAVTGDGSYMFSVPSSVHWMARRYGLPFLQVVLNNGGWNAPRHSALSVHPSGFASRVSDADLGLSFDPAPDYGGIAAAAGGAWTRKITRMDEVAEALDAAFRVVREEKRAAVLDVAVAPR